MTNRVVRYITLFLCLFAAATVSADSGDEAAIREVVDRAYVHGVHIDQDPEKIRSGMHESFVMFVQTDDGVRQVTRDGWIERIEAGKARGGQGDRPETKAVIEVLDQAGNAAVVRVNLFQDGKQVFTDYISLYRFDDGWKLVGKIFHRH